MRRPIFRRRSPWPRIFSYLALCAVVFYAATIYVLDPYGATPLIVWAGLLVGGVTLVGLLDRPDKGEIHLDGADASGLSARERNRIRCRDVGFVFQFYHLLPELNVLENTLLPAKVEYSSLAWLKNRRRLTNQATGVLERLGLKERLRHRSSELSGGERQRVAIARALMNHPKVLLADEPTGNLDSKTGKQILDVLQEFHKSGQTILMVTHDASIAAQADRVLQIRDGRLVDQ